MVDWQWIIYGLAIIFLIFLFCLYRNNFYLWRYLVKSCIIFRKIELKIKDKRKKLNFFKLIILYIKKEGKNILSCCSEIWKEIIILILLYFCGIKILD